MNLTDVTFKLLFLFLPGLISAIIINALTFHRKWDRMNYLLYSFVLGLIDYSVWFLVTRIKVLRIEDCWFFTNIGTISDINVFEVAVVTLIIAGPVGLVLSFCINKKFIYRIARLLHISNKIGDIDIWCYIFNAIEQEKIDWVVIRDYENNRIFEGQVAAYSTSEARDKDELFLINVKVYVNSTAELLYETPGLYYSFERGKVMLEFPNLSSKVEK